METAYIACGSNIDPEKNILASLRLLVPEGLRSVSTVYRTEPIGQPGQPFFYNCVAELSTSRPPFELKYEVLRPIEAALGRRRAGEDRYSARQADLDLIIYDALEVRTAELVLPDPDIYTRAFLALPLLELAPTLVMPDGKSLRELAGSFDRIGMEELKTYTVMIRKELFG
ncbi:2-amino-4-hydroxy-6-hydroxymethyldihydropteridinediphosphokinase [Gammaproteobacteria bacterium]|nr:2-amino-4-hydroxy-6-hydroxymethyldihydropteridinediphosphokinase [Gammaproteobacteria bacterium]